MESVGYPAFNFAVCVTNFVVAFIKKKMEYLLANIIFMFFHGLFISCFYASDYITLLNMTWTRD